MPAIGSRQILTAVSTATAADGPLPRAPFAECVTLGKLVFAECLPVSSVQHSVKGLFAESLTLPRAALGKAFFAECLTLGKHVFSECGLVPSVLHSVNQLIIES